MSELIDWIRVAMWASAWVAFQASLAIYEWWTRPPRRLTVAERTRQRENQFRASKFGKLLLGEKVDGWKLCKFDSISDPSWSPLYHSVLPLWPRNGNDAPVDTSVLAILRGRSPENGEWIYIMRRISLVAPGLHDDIVQIFINDSSGWSQMINECYIDERVVAIWWQRRGTNEMRIVLVEIKSKSYQILETTLPHRHAEVCTIFKDPESRHLMVLLQVRHDDNNTTFHLEEYETSPSENIHSPIVDQVDSWQLAWHQGDWSFSSAFYSAITLAFDLSACPPDYVLNFPGAVYRINNFDTSESCVVSLDRNGFDELGDKEDWTDEFMRTPIGLRMIEAKKSLKKVHASYNSIFIRFGSIQLHRSHLFACVTSGSYVHRPLVPPSLKYLAAEAFCLAHPNFDFADLKNQIRFDIFDGLLDEKNPVVIRM